MARLSKGMGNGIKPSLLLHLFSSYSNMPKVSEIDQIFATKDKRTLQSDPKQTSPVATAPVEKKRKSKKAKASTSASGATDPVVAESSAGGSPPIRERKRPAPETIMDPSLPRSTKRARMETTATNAAIRSSAKARPSLRQPPKTSTARLTEKDRDDEAAFRDSRGTEPRRKTEEGWNIYKEDELGLGDDGGDTPLCPFDCDCCF